MSKDENPVVANMGRGSRTLMVFVAGIALGALMMVEIVPASSVVEISEVGTGPVAGGSNVGGPTASEGPSAPGGGNGARPGASTGNSGGVNPNAPTSETGTDPGGPGQPVPPGDPALKCEPGANGGATDQGVTAEKIDLATTVVESGVGKSFLGEVRSAMEAVKNRVNREGGICGRILNIRYVDDGWDAARGATFLRNFIDEGVFAIPVGPSSEGLNVVIQGEDFDTAEIPVVGTDGLIRVQYEREGDGGAQPWVWPVAVATVSSARIIAKDAFDRGATRFSIVFDADYRFGVEGAEAFNAEVKRLTGSDIDGYEPGSTSCNLSYCGVTSGQSSYSPQVRAFQEGDFVALFLEPDTALKWMNDSNAPAANDPNIPYGFSAAQPLFTRSFGESCRGNCHTMKVWTGFKPYEEHYKSDPDVQRWVEDLEITNPSADPNNQFSLGAFIGMELLVEGLRAVGPDLKRSRLREALNHMTLDTGLTLTNPMQFSSENRYVATTMQAWEIQYTGTFSGWRAGSIVSDPAFGG